MEFDLFLSSKFTAKRSSSGGEFDAFSDKSEEERIGGGSEEFSRKSEDIDDVYEQGTNKSKDSSFRRERRRFFQEGIENYGAASSTCRAGKRMVQESDGNGIRYSRMEKEIDSMNPEIGKGMDWRIRERDTTEGFLRAQRIDEVGNRYSAQKYTEEGRLNYHLHDRYSVGEPLQERNEMIGYGEVAYPREEDRAELLQKLDILRDKLSRSCDLADRSKDNFPLHRRMLPPPQDPYGYSDKWWFPEGDSTMLSFPDNRSERTWYTDEPSSSVDRPAMFGYAIYPSLHTPGPSTDPFRPQMLRRHPYQQKPSPAPYRDGNIFPLDSFESHPPALSPHHHPSCSCFQCYGSRYQAPSRLPPNLRADTRFADASKNLPFFLREYPNEYAPWDYSAKISDAPPSFQSHSEWPTTDLDSEVSSDPPSRVLLANSSHLCQPVAGGAPFLACQNCKELLQLPKKTFTNNAKEKKIRCGACSALIILVVDAKKLDISVHVEADDIACGKMHLPQKKNLSEGSSYTQVHINFSSEDYDFQAMDRDLVVSVSTGQRSCSKSGDMRNSHSAYSSSCSGEVGNLESSPAATEVSNSADLLPAKEKLSPPPAAGSPLEDYFDYSNKFHFVSRLGLGDASRSGGHSELDKATPIKCTTTREEESFIKDGSAATEIEISSNEYSNTTGTSLDSDEMRKGMQLRANSTAESFFAGIIKKSFRDLNKSTTTVVEQEKHNITVNGNLIPDRLVKKAEKVAGRIHPGHYWYVLCI